MEQHLKKSEIRSRLNAIEQGSQSNSPESVQDGNLSQTQIATLSSQQPFQQQEALSRGESSIGRKRTRPVEGEESSSRQTRKRARSTSRLERIWQCVSACIPNLN